MTDPIAMLEDIRREYAEKCGRWIRREVGNAQHAVDDTEHETSLKELAAAWIEYLDLLRQSIPAAPAPLTVERNEVESPGR